MTPDGIEPATFQFVAQRLNYCATAVPNRKYIFAFLNAVLSCDTSICLSVNIVGNENCILTYIRLFILEDKYKKNPLHVRAKSVMRYPIL